jgi:hypothetical protein
MPTFWYMLRRCGTLGNSSVPSKDEEPSVPKKPAKVPSPGLAAAGEDARPLEEVVVRGVDSEEIPAAR